MYYEVISVELYQEIIIDALIKGEVQIRCYPRKFA